MSVSGVECVALIKINTHISPGANIRENLQEEIPTYLVTTEITYWHLLPSDTGDLCAAVVFVWSESVDGRTET